MDNYGKSLKDMSIKEAIVHDVMSIVFRGNVIIDPLPGPVIPVAPIVAARKAFNGLKRIATAIKDSLD